jgi:hypothetical protein
MTPRVRQYAADVAAAHGVTAETIFSESRKGPAARARRQLYQRLREDGFSSSQIGHWLGRDASTVRATLTRKRPAYTRPEMVRDAVGRWIGRAE